MIVKESLKNLKTKLIAKRPKKVKKRLKKFFKGENFKKLIVLICALAIIATAILPALAYM